jgi:hypothetical protein
MLQAVAAGWHHKSAEQLKEIGDKVGRERIMVVHGMSPKSLFTIHYLGKYAPLPFNITLEDVDPQLFDSAVPN